MERFKHYLLGMLSLASISGHAAQQPATTATFAGGCFWCMESDFEKVEGVTDVLSGYIGGHLQNPTYKKISAGDSGHAEAIQITFDPSRIDYVGLLEIFWRSIDPTRSDRQFCDLGSQYRPEIFYHNEQQQAWAEASKQMLEQTKPFEEPIVVEITAASIFYPAEEYHQDYYKKNPIRYRYYRYSCGRDKRLNILWGSR
ncbi:MAG: peptide-methionine (S)-S-oxide reductase MsrA [Candidatus Polarisedimenticolaceae bacterium]|nr:peptide-methionine (S)-S-oxide reductase MsrA [Candidatus Polarisedimenticolaceae bacterium]